MRLYFPLLAALVISLPFGCGNKAEVEPEETPAAESTPPPAAEPAPVVEDYLVIADAVTPADYVGQEVRLSNLEVSRVTGDNTILVQPQGGGKTMLVYIEETPAPETKQGDQITLEGIVDQMPGKDALTADWGIDDTEYGQIASNQIYIRAKSLTKQG
jgi:hypothetical protein